MTQTSEIKKGYLTLDEVAAACGVPLEDLRYFGEEGNLTICLRRIPVKIAIESILMQKPYTDDPKEQRRIMQMLEEPQPLHPTDIYRIFAVRPNRIEITRLKTIPVMNIVNVINPPILVGFDDLIITREEKERFAFAFLNKTTAARNPLRIISPDFKNFMLYEREYFFGEKQARVIKYLYEKYMAGDPWVHSKKLLDIADSHSWRLHNLFNHSRDWRNVIRTGKNGYYMFNLPSDKTPPLKRPEHRGLDLFDVAAK